MKAIAEVRGMASLHKRGERLASTIWLLINRIVRKSVDSTVENYVPLGYKTCAVARESREKREPSYCLHY